MSSPTDGSPSGVTTGRVGRFFEVPPDPQALIRAAPRPSGGTVGVEVDASQHIMSSVCTP